MDDALHIASWNVNGLRAQLRKDIRPWRAVDCDLIFLQETKARPEQLPAEEARPDGWHSYWHPAERAGYSGVACYSRVEPDEVVTGCGEAEFDCEGRILGLRFGDLIAIGAYFPNSQEKGKRLDYKLAFCRAMEDLLDSWRRRGCDTVLLGDYNIAHRPIDLARPKQNEQNAGYLPEERAWMSRYTEELGYCDVFRDWNPDLTDAYTWWSYRGGARSRNVGWRIDYATVNDDLAERVTAIDHHPDIQGSDHCPVSIAIAM